MERHISRLVLCAAISSYAATSWTAESNALLQATSAALVTKSAALLDIPPEARRSPSPFEVASTPPRLETVLYPIALEHPEWGSWSQWGDGVIGANGQFYSAIGNHGGPEGRSYIYAYDPQKRRLRLAVDQQKLLGQQAGDWGFGKIHCRLEELDGLLYWATYWGHAPPEDYAQEAPLYGMVVRADPATGAGEILGTAKAPLVIPTGMADHRARLFYALPCNRTWAGRGFLVYDLDKRETIYHGQVDEERGRRFILVDEPGGGAFFTVQPDPQDPALWLARYDIARNAVDLKAIRLPEGYGTMRAGTETRSPQGLYYIVCEGKIVRIDPEKKTAQPLGPLWGSGEYTTVVELSPGGRYLYAIPAAHGNAWRHGAPVIQYDLKTNRRKVLAFLAPYFRDQYGYRVGGSYCLELSDDGERLFFGINGALSDTDSEAFGAPACMLLHIPAAERPDDSL